MKADEGAATARGEDLREIGDDLAQTVELAVDRDTNRLKHLRGRMDPTWLRPTTQRRQLGRRRQVATSASTEDSAGHTPCPFHLTILAKNPCQLSLVPLVEQIPRRLAVPAHPHVDRAIL